MFKFIKNNFPFALVQIQSQKKYMLKVRTPTLHIQLDFLLYIEAVLPNVMNIDQNHKHYANNMT